MDDSEHVLVWQRTDLFDDHANKKYLVTALCDCGEPFVGWGIQNVANQVYKHRQEAST
jgi:hypothetical protein